MLFLTLAGSASAQQLVTTQAGNYPREAESILIASCRVVGERFEIAFPNPRVELRLGEKVNAVENHENAHVIHLRRWNKTLFKRAAVIACMRAAEHELMTSLAEKVRDY